MTQRVEVPLLGHRNSYALVHTQPAERAVVFVHGFKGHPNSTWLDFQGLADGEHPWWTETDLFFYSYESVKTPTLASATDLLRFVGSIFPVPNPLRLGLEQVIWWPRPSSSGGMEFAAVENPLFELLANRAYKTLVLVGHSEGGFLLRRMVLTEIRNFHERQIAINSSTLLNRAERLRLFAPAIMGHQVSGWPGFFARFSKAIQAMLSASVVYGDLTSSGQIIANTQKRTEEEARRSPGIAALRAKVLWGREDRVVAMDCYRDDFQAMVDQKDHRSICKPTIGYQRPLEFVREP